MNILISKDILGPHIYEHSHPLKFKKNYIANIQINLHVEKFLDGYI